MSTDTRVWLLPDGKVALKRNSDWMQVTQWGSFWDNANESHATHIVFLDELPDGAVPLVAVPAEEAHRDGDYVRVACGDQYRYTLDRAVEQVEYLTKELGHALAVREFLNRESTSAEAVRRKVLADLIPGLYRLEAAGNPTLGVVTPEGRIFVYGSNVHEFGERTQLYQDRTTPWKFVPLFDGGLSPVVTE